ncbi:hypothetical protein Tco_0601763 [Tanacetum coccineum]
MPRSTKAFYPSTKLDTYLMVHLPVLKSIMPLKRKLRPSQGHSEILKIITRTLTEENSKIQGSRTCKGLINTILLLSLSNVHADIPVFTDALYCRRTSYF